MKCVSYADRRISRYGALSRIVFGHKLIRRLVFARHYLAVRGVSSAVPKEGEDKTGTWRGRFDIGSEYAVLRI